MGRLAGVSGRIAVKKFLQLGYSITRQRGSHVRLHHADPKHRPLTVPLHAELKKGLLHQLIKDAGLTVKDFLDL